MIVSIHSLQLRREKLDINIEKGDNEKVSIHSLQLRREKFKVQDPYKLFDFVSIHSLQLRREKYKLAGLINSERQFQSTLFN